jgi:hypothetical protein
MMADNPAQFKTEVQKTLVRHANAVNTLTSTRNVFLRLWKCVFVRSSEELELMFKNKAADMLENFPL